MAVTAGSVHRPVARPQILAEEEVGKRHRPAQTDIFVFSFLHILFMPAGFEKSSSCKAREDRDARRTEGTLSVTARSATPQMDFYRSRFFSARVSSAGST